LLGDRVGDLRGFVEIASAIRLRRRLLLRRCGIGHDGLDANGDDVHDGGSVAAKRQCNDRRMREIRLALERIC
jgi:hypothetical protein